ncbi:alpha/beta hydrolase [Flammeovirga sp. MY04]|uniref:alpha/beta fold hydrolase n=1 Tax=Flammeovirga sp. MY04 TaxID=1191459 RepID=UPI000806084D|nr:alpha/beta fold hydrolase [Flammeovirga sp. MY04]ANQ51346.1 alpha/beta hydrolase [Flammeovirga sp. MY04]
MTNDINTSETFVKVGTDQLFVKHYAPSAVNTSKAILMIHGSIESGRIFYSLKDKGLGPWLASKGYQVFIPDFRGRGRSMPKVSSNSKNNQYDAIEEEIPALINYIHTNVEDAELNFVTHSWGGVWLMAHIARHPELKVNRIINIAVKRSISVSSFKKWFEVDIVWKHVGKLMTNLFGYFPAVEMKIGQENESRGVYEDCKRWVYAKDKWVDTEDGFDYINEFDHRKNIPPTLYITGLREFYLGHQTDVKRLMKEVNGDHDQFILLSKETGFAHDYDHINICTSKSGGDDHFPLIEAWLKSEDIAPWVK